MAASNRTGQRIVLDKQAFDRLLRSRGWGSLNQFADDAGLSYSTLARMRASSHEPSARYAFAVARALGVSVETVFGPEPEEVATL